MMLYIHISYRKSNNSSERKGSISIDRVVRIYIHINKCLRNDSIVEYFLFHYRTVHFYRISLLYTFPVEDVQKIVYITAAAPPQFLFR